MMMLVLTNIKAISLPPTPHSTLNILYQICFYLIIKYFQSVPKPIGDYLGDVEEDSVPPSKFKNVNRLAGIS